MDTKLNPECIEMYAEPRAHAGILEPEGLMAVKFKPDGVNMRKIQDKHGVNGKIASQIALRFLELHDTAGRMQAVDAIKGIVPWAESRNFFIRRLEEYYKTK